MDTTDVTYTQTRETYATVVNATTALLSDSLQDSSSWCGHHCCLQNQYVLRPRLPHGGKRDAVIGSNQPSLVLNRESKQVYVGQLPRSMDSRRIHDIRIQ